MTFKAAFLRRHTCALKESHALRLFCFVSTQHQEKLVESENFSSGALHFDPKHHTFNMLLSFVSFQTFYRSFGSRQPSFERMERKGLKHFKGFEPFKVCTLRERIGHILSKNCHVLANLTLFSEAERGNCFVCALFTAFQKVEF